MLADILALHSYIPLGHRQSWLLNGILYNSFTEKEKKIPYENLHCHFEGNSQSTCKSTNRTDWFRDWNIFYLTNNCYKKNDIPTNHLKQLKREIFK